jgi:hypothetical protein
MTPSEMRNEIQRLWDVYTTSEDIFTADAAYDSWCRLVADLDALIRDRTTRRVSRAD